MGNYEGVNFSPWPDIGKSWRFEWRKATWMLARPWYGANDVVYDLSDLTWLSPVTFWFPFVSYTKAWNGDKPTGLHFYFGWKPIPPHLDKAFYWTALKTAQAWVGEGRKFVQLSARWGLGDAR